MWNIFYSKNNNLNFLFSLLEEVKKDIFDDQEKKIKEYFATKVVTYFDNKMIFHAKKGLDVNLMESLSLAEQEMTLAGYIFNPIKIYVIKEDEGFCVLFHGLKDISILENNSFFSTNFSYIQNSLNNINSLERLEFSSWSTLAFHFDLANFAQGWINHTPALEERSHLQAQYILYHMTFKKSEASLVEKVKFDENIKNHPQYEELLKKVLKVMPKIEMSLEQEWRTKLINVKREKKSKTNI